MLTYRRSAAALAAILFALPAVRYTAASPSSGAAVRRVTTDGSAKYGITLCGDGSTVGWLEVIRDARLSPDDIVIVKAAATAGGWSKEIFRASNGAFVSPIKGPHYDAADTNYRLNLTAQKILFSADGKRVVLLLDEFAKSRHYDLFLTMELPGGEARLMPPALPPGMGTFTGYTNYNSFGVWLANSYLQHSLSEDGRFVFFNVKAFGTVAGNGKTLDALVAMDLDAGKAIRVAGYQAMDAQSVLTPGTPEYAETRLASSGDRVVFACGNAYWVGDAKGSPLRKVAEGASGAPMLAGDGRFVVETESGSFFPVDGGSKIAMPSPGGGRLVFPFWDGQPGFLTHPLSAAEEIGVVRPSGAVVLVKAAEAGLGAGSRFAVAAVSSSYRYEMASRDGRKVVLSAFGADGKNDLFLTEQPGASAAAAAAAPAAVPIAVQPAAGPRGFATGEPVPAASASVGPGGGEVQVTAPDSPIRGFRIRVPGGAYREPRNFTISTASITRHGLPQGAEILTPLIRVENGGAFADIPLTLTVPVKAAASGSAVLAFYVDETTGKLEGMPLIEASADSITVLTSHFSSFFVARMPEGLLPASIDSGFRPGVDDWQMVNEGSFITPGGHCTGQSIMAMWYYYEKALHHEARLFNRYDNNGLKDAPTPGFWPDDSLAVRLIATVWRDLEWGSQQRMASLRLSDLHADRTILNAFRLSMYVTGEPQLAEIFRFDAKAGKWQGHAIIVYKVEKDRLLVADPNFPGHADRLIEFDGAANRFKPYFSGETASSAGVEYPQICYVAKTALIPWAKLGARWEEYQRSFSARPQENDKLIGREYFPAYKIYLAEAGGRTELADYHVTGSDRAKVEVESAGNQIRVLAFSGASPLAPGANGEIALKPGYNDLGFYIQAAAGGYWRWLDFRRFRIFRNTLSIDPGELKGKPGTSYTLTARTTAGAAPAEAAAFEWRFGDGSAPATAPGASTAHRFDRPGRYTVTVRASDRQGRPLGEASAAAVIEGDAAPPKAPSGPPKVAEWVHELKGIQFVFRADYVRSDGTRADGYELSLPPDEADWYSLPIQWEGASFRGTYDRQPKQYSPGTTHLTVSGTIREAWPEIFLDFEARMVDTLPDSRNPPPYGSTAVQEFKAKGIPLLEIGRGNRDSRYLESKRIEGDTVRDLAPTLVVDVTSRGRSTGVQSIEWRGSSIKVEMRRGIRMK